MRINLTAAVVAVGLCLLIGGVALSAESNVYWRVDLHQGAYIIAYGQGTTEQAAWDDCFRLKAITRAMTAVETRRNAVAAITMSAVRWCQNPKRYATVSPDPVVLPPVNCVVSEWGAWSNPAWLACADGMQSRSIVRTRTVVTQPANGGAACPSLVETQPQTRVCPGAAIITWTLPARNTDGTALTNLAGVRVHWGTLPSEPINSVQLTGPLTRHVLYGLPAGTHYFGVRAYTSTGMDSDLSNVVPKTVL
jgi:hypothetical protein